MKALIGKAQGYPHIPQHETAQHDYREKPQALGSEGSLIPSLTFSALLREAVSLQVPASLFLRGNTTRKSEQRGWDTKQVRQWRSRAHPGKEVQAVLLSAQSPLPSSGRRNKAILHAHAWLAQLRKGSGLGCWGLQPGLCDPAVSPTQLRYQSGDEASSPTNCSLRNGCSHVSYSPASILTEQAGVDRGKTGTAWQDT